MSVNDGHNLHHDDPEDIPLPNGRANDPPNNFAYNPWNIYYAWQMFCASTRYREQPPPPPPPPEHERTAPPPPPANERGQTPPPRPEGRGDQTPPPDEDQRHRPFTPPPVNEDNRARFQPQDQRSVASTRFRNQRSNESEYSWPSHAPSLASQHDFPQQQQNDRQQPRHRQMGTSRRQHFDQRRFQGQQRGRNSNPRYNPYAFVNVDDTNAEIDRLKSKLTAERKKNRYLASQNKEMQSKIDVLQKMNNSSIMVPFNKWS